jgi:hypothetical protein
VDTAALSEPIRTPLRSPGEGGPITIYFRTRFVYGGALPQATLRLQQLIDDGFVLYLNGMEIHRTGTGSGQTHSTLANRVVGDAGYEGPFDVLVTNLVGGENILAAELHQADQFSSDAVFGLHLTADKISSQPVPLEPVLQFDHEGNQLVIQWEAEAVTLEEAPAPNGPWMPVPGQTNPFFVPLEQEQLFFRLRQP